MEFSLQLQRLKAAYDESKRTTKAAFLQKRINQLASMLSKLHIGWMDRAGRVLFI